LVNVSRSRGGEREPLEKPWRKRSVMRDCALGDMTIVQLAEKYEVSNTAITDFKRRYREEIQAIIDDAENEFAGIWIASKEQRLSAYRDLWERAWEDEDFSLCSKIEKQVAEEMGHLPGRITVSGQLDTTTKYTINGVDPEALR
jgi:hypothetical protein